MLPLSDTGGRLSKLQHSNINLSLTSGPSEGKERLKLKTCPYTHRIANLLRKLAKVWNEFTAHLHKA